MKKLKQFKKALENGRVNFEEEKLSCGYTSITVYNGENEEIEKDYHFVNDILFGITITGKDFQKSFDIK